MIWTEMLYQVPQYALSEPGLREFRVGVLLLLVSAAALVRRWRVLAAMAFGLAVSVKLLPIVLLPLDWKRVRMRDGALVTIVLGLLCIPFLNHGRIPFGSLGTYVHRIRFSE